MASEKTGKNRMLSSFAVLSGGFPWSPNGNNDIVQAWGINGQYLHRTGDIIVKCTYFYCIT